MNAATTYHELNQAIDAAIAHNAQILTPDRLMNALTDDSDTLPADLIRTGRAQAALRAARNGAWLTAAEPLEAEHLEFAHPAMRRALTDLRRRLAA